MRDGPRLRIGHGEAAVSRVRRLGAPIAIDLERDERTGLRPGGTARVGTPHGASLGRSGCGLLPTLSSSVDGLEGFDRLYLLLGSRLQHHPRPDRVRGGLIDEDETPGRA